MSRRSVISRVQSQQRAASRMTPGTSMWTEQQLVEKRDRYLVPKIEEPLDPTIPVKAWVGSFSSVIPNPPEFPGVKVISGVVIHSITGAAYDPIPPSGWSTVGGRNIGGSNRWSTGVEANVWAWVGGSNVRGGSIQWAWTTADRSKYLGGTVLYIYAEEVFGRGSWSVIEGQYFTSTGAGALSQGTRTLALTPTLPAGCVIGWQIGAMNSTYTNLSGNGVATVYQSGTCGHYHRSPSGSPITDLTTLKNPGSGNVTWRYIGAYGSPAGLSMAAGWYP